MSEELRHLMHVRVHIEQAVLQRRAIGQNRRRVIDQNIAKGVHPRHVDRVSRPCVVDFAGHRDWAQPFGLHIAKALADEAFCGNGRERVGADGKTAGVAPFDVACDRNDEFMLRICIELIF